MSKKYFRITGWTLAIILVLGGAGLLMQRTLFAASDTIDTSTEFPKDFEAARKQYHADVNCFFSMAAVNVVSYHNEQFRKDTGQDSDVSVPQLPSACTSFSTPVASAYKTVLDNFLKKIPQNLVQMASGKKDTSLTFDTDNIKTCNLDTDGKMTTPETAKDYFAHEASDMISPTYAVAVVSNCYRLLYMRQLDRYISYGEVLTTPNLKTFEAIQVERNLRTTSIEPEKGKVPKVLDLALAAFEEFSQQYPLHIRYAELIKHSQLLRDQFRRLRVATDQLQYKLPNQSTNE